MEATASSVQFLSAELLRPNDYNPNRMTEDEFGELVEEVRHLGGLPKPIVVRPAATEGYEIVDGEHGWRAATEVGLAEVPCEVIEADDFEAMRQTYKRNQHGTHDRVALGRMFRRMIEDRGTSNRELAKEINVSEGTIRNALLFAEVAELRNRYARPAGGGRDRWFEEMTVRQARLYKTLPAPVSDLWLDAGGDEDALVPPDVHFECYEDLAHYYQDVVGTGLVEAMARGSFTEGVAKVWELWRWRDKHRRLLGDDADAYIRAVVDLHPEKPTPVEILDRLPVLGGRPFLPPEEWAAALRVAWEKGGSVFGVLGRISDVAKLKAGETGVPVEDLEDPRVALMKLQVEQDAPDFVREAEIPLRDKHFLTYAARADCLPDEEVSAFKREVAERLGGEHRRYRGQRAEYHEWLRQASMEEVARALAAGGGPPYPKSPPTAEGVWDHHVSRWHERKRMEAESALLDDSNKRTERVVGKLREAAPKTFEKDVGGKPAWQVLDQRLRAMPRPELVLMAAVLLRTPVGSWLKAVQDEQEGAA